MNAVTPGKQSSDSQGVNLEQANMEYGPESFIHPVEDASDPMWSLAPVATAVAVATPPEDSAEPDSPEDQVAAASEPRKRPARRAKRRRDVAPQLGQKLTSDGFPSGAQASPDRDQSALSRRAASGKRASIGAGDAALAAGSFRGADPMARERGSLNWTGRPLDGMPGKNKERGSLNWTGRPLDIKPAKPRDRGNIDWSARSNLKPAKGTKATKQVMPVEPLNPWDLIQRTFLEAKPVHVTISWDQDGKPFLRAANGNELRVAVETVIARDGSIGPDRFTLEQRCWWGAVETLGRVSGAEDSATSLVRGYIDHHQVPLKAAVAQWVGDKLMAARQEGDAKTFTGLRAELVRTCNGWRELINGQLGDDGWPASADRLLAEALGVLDGWLEEEPESAPPEQ